MGAGGRHHFGDTRAFGCEPLNFRECLSRLKKSPPDLSAGSKRVKAWVVLSGLLHGGYAHAYKDILFLVNGPPELYYPLNPDEHYPPDNIFFEITGVLEMVTGYFIALLTYRLISDGIAMMTGTRSRFGAPSTSPP